MRAILPGRPQTKLQAVSVGLWEGRQIIAYISGDALVLLRDPNTLIQTIYTEDNDEGEGLIAVQVHEVSGKIATCSSNKIYIYQPFDGAEDVLQWSLQCTLELEDTSDSIGTLSWGANNELLVGSSSLTLFTLNGTATRTWSKPLAKPVKLAQFSYDSGFIASNGRHDRLVKIWRRLSFGSADEKFDYGYLPHPTTVVGIHWRRPFHRDQSIDNVLYTICADNKVRIWAASDPHGLQILQLWAEIDLVESIMTRNLYAPATQHLRRYAFIMDSKDFTIATERAVSQASNDEKEQHALSHLVEVANRSPEVVVVLDDHGNMSAWGLENVGCKTRKTSDIFNIAHVGGLHIHFAAGPDPQQDNVQLVNFCAEQKAGGLFTILAHHFDGRVEWLEGRIDQLFDPEPRKTRLTTRNFWTGHTQPVKKAIRTATGKAMITRSDANEGIVWLQKRSQSGSKLLRHSVVGIKDHVHRMCLLQEGDYLVFLHHGSISLWDTRYSTAKEIARQKYQIKGKPLCLIIVPETEGNAGTVHIATISSEMKGVAWEIKVPPHGTHLNGAADSIVSLEQYCTFDLGSGDDLAFVLPVDPAGEDPTISGFLDTFARDVALSYTNAGVLRLWTARVNPQEPRLDWLCTSKVETGIDNPSLAAGTSIRKAAVIDRDRRLLTIWDTRSSQLEYEEEFEPHMTITDLDWSSTPDNQSILAVGFPDRVVIYGQLRYDYLNAGPAWASFREIRLRGLTSHPIGDSVWISNGNLVIGAGNQLFVQDENVEVSETLLPDLRLSRRNKISNHIFTVVSRLNGPLPVFHPQFIIQCILAGRIVLVQRILVSLYKSLKFYTEGDALDSTLGITYDDVIEEQNMNMSTSIHHKEMQSSYADFTDPEEPDLVDEDVATKMNEKLSTIVVPHLSSHEQINLADIIECMGTVEKHRRSMDENGSRFLLFFRQHLLRASQPSAGKLNISWREITWAFHSGSQDILVDQVSRHFQGKVGWKEAKECGLCMWMTDLTALRAQFEVVARNEYTKSEDRNPVDCSLYYLALKKKAVLVGLWRMASWNREQAATQRLLTNNFSDPRWKTAALKNAYALMGKRRFEYAAAFFLLAGNLKDAVSVLANQHGDTQLAIAVARVYEGDDGPILRSFLEERILPQAVREGNRWLATWAFWLLGRRDRAVKALVTPLNSLLSPPESPGLQAKLFLTDDPALVVLYKQLREKSLQTLKGASQIPPRAEWDFIMHTARLYGRMGCDLLALDLVRNWEFLTPPPPTFNKSFQGAVPFESFNFGHPFSPTTEKSQGSDLPPGFDPRKLLRRRSSLVVADMPLPSPSAALHHSFSEMGHPAAIGEEKEGNDEAKVDGEKEGKKEDIKGRGSASEEKKKPPPTQFQEPDANSLLDSFGF